MLSIDAYSAYTMSIVAYLFLPLHALPVDLLLNGDVRHARGRRGSMPVLLARRDPNNIAWPDVFDFPAPLLNPSRSGRDDQDLAQRVGVPRRSSAGLEGHEGAGPA